MNAFDANKLYILVKDFKVIFYHNFGGGGNVREAAGRLLDCHQPRGDGCQCERRQAGSEAARSSAGLGRRQGPRCHPASQACAGTEGSLPALPNVGASYLQCRGRRAVKTPLQQPGNLAGREKEVQGGHGQTAGVRGPLPTCRRGPRTMPATAAILPVSSTCRLMTTQKRRRPVLAQPMVGRDDSRARLRRAKPIESDD